MALVLFIAALFVLGIPLTVWMVRYQFRKGEEMLSSWARARSLRLLAHERANPPYTGPMNRSASNKQIFYRVTVQDEQGHQRSGVVRVGSEAMGIWSDKVEVSWDP